MKKQYINGMRGIACFLVMFAHYCGIYKHAEEATCLESTFLAFLDKNLNILIDESFWLYSFFVISGYVISLGKITNMKGLICKCIKRALRLLFPLFGACLFIFYIYKFIGFHNRELGFIINAWLSSFYSKPITYKDIFVEPFRAVFLGYSQLNSPWWCIRDMLFSSFAVYSCNFFLYKFKKIKGIQYLFGILIALTCYLIGGGINNNIILAFACGMFIKWYDKDIKQLKVPDFLWVLLLCILFLCIFLQWHLELKSIYFSAIIIVFNRIEKLQAILKVRMCLWLGTLSFGIFSFHWPVYCSIGSKIYIFGIEKMEINWLVFLCIVACICITVIVSLLYHITVERYVYKIISWLEDVYSLKLSTKYKEKK